MTIHQARPVSRDEEKRWESLSPFELKNELIDLAQRHAEDEHTKHAAATLLNAGRGNPNWIATAPREAFFLLGAFGLAEARRDWDEWDGLAGAPDKDGIAGRFRDFLREHHGEPGADLLARSLEYGVSGLGFAEDDWVWELADGVIGDHYPSPDRMLPHAERVVGRYLVQEMHGGREPDAPFDLFATEGGTAAMCYLFDSAQVNGLLAQGDTIAIMTPIFTPYLEIPKLERYAFDVLEIEATRVDADGGHTWQYDPAEIDKLADPKVKALFLVNPSNPPSVMLDGATLDRIAEIARTANPDLAIITDDVYGTFVDGFRSLMAAAPRNTLGVYSFSKYFGCTGWRLGVISVSRDNIFDERLARLPEADKARLRERYGSISLDPDGLRFVDRLVADSRDVALNHTAGLSLPQQVQMALFALAALLDEAGAYKRNCRAIISRRLHALAKGMGVPVPQDPLAAGYYVELDLLSYVRRDIGEDFARWLEDGFEPADPVFRLAAKGSVVLLNGGGFDGPPWSVRVSLANLRDDAYERIGRALRELVEEYKAEYDAAKSG
ncbi:bifunctional aspartate transaminase/aspartate 4-decarboxylase [Actinomadura parmotrematis]|uniref:Bifunctional aspartate transaminase/aspartate 4-decarboxylase n=1 Tax=Actinomadura parmotrematis TaxID=2864039 RepID=A0ABS7FSG2_9ACTN|nr:bifunctional aspartate transaminase/aspartate 4-decarboxylase [Actinomadura parmotrematis]MBW8483350.1 bifunctional aspartate transaminase/aspartate 4-decarboxylase [Actinomadura parmotrematis]